MKATYITPPPTTRIVVLEMTEDEAETLMLVCANVGGDQQKSRRRDTNSISKVLGKLGIKRATGKTAQITSENSIYFKGEEY